MSQFRDDACSLSGPRSRSARGGYPPTSRLTVAELSLTETNRGYRADFVVENHNVRKNVTADFHDVSVVGYSNDGRLVCDTQIGDVFHDFDINDGKPVTMDCSGFPSMITFTAAEFPCDDDVVIDIAVYDDAEGSWLLDRYRRDCTEGPPPDPRT